MHQLLTTLVMLIILTRPSSILESNAQASQKCPKHGSFGPDCSYACHCDLGSDDCNSDTGECTSGPCGVGWFGPSCQYMKAPVVLEPPWLQGKVIGCNNKDNQKSVTLTLVQPIPFTWARGTIRNIGSDYQISINLWDTHQKPVSCHKSLYFDADGKYFDISCETSSVVGTVELKGDLVLHLCSVFISAGRNISVNEQVIGIHDPAEIAILNESSCSHCREDLFKLNMSFSFPVNVKWIKVFKSLCPAAQRNAQHYRMDLTMSTWDKQQSVRIPESKAANNSQPYVLLTFPMEEVYSIAVANAEQNTSLIVCRLEIFGDYACEESTYGHQCSKECECKESNQYCHSATGLCNDSSPSDLHNNTKTGQDAFIITTTICVVLSVFSSLTAVFLIQRWKRKSCSSLEDVDQDETQGPCQPKCINKKEEILKFYESIMRGEEFDLETGESSIIDLYFHLGRQHHIQVNETEGSSVDVSRARHLIGRGSSQLGVEGTSLRDVTGTSSRDVTRTSS